MIFGFNTDIKVGKLVFHVQTEDRGKENPLIDTTIYYRGRVLAKRAVSYRAYFESSDFDPADLKELVERHHKRWVGTVEKGELEEMREIQQAKSGPEKINVVLLNPHTLFRASFLAVSVGLTKDGNGTPVENAVVRVQFKTEYTQSVVTRQSSGNGRVDVKFPMPKIGSEGAELVIQAKTENAKGELRYNLKRRGG